MTACAQIAADGFKVALASIRQRRVGFFFRPINADPYAARAAGYLTGIVGASNNPVSGVTVIVLLAVALFLKFVGISQTVGPQLAILSGAIVCTAAAMAG
ncbi:MAG: hypothetical protein LAP21_05055, partial [Acidobacteriia bacterium]|nr:hypothetical protein [Terriglobia bacterium]